MCFWPSPIRRWPVVEAPLDARRSATSEGAQHILHNAVLAASWAAHDESLVRWRREVHHFAGANRANPLAAPGSDR